MKQRKTHILHTAAIIAISLGCIGFAALLSQTVVNAATPTVRLFVSPPTLNIERGDVFIARIRLEKTASDKVNYVDARLRFDASKLEVVSTSKAGSEFSEDGGPSISYLNSTGSISVEGSSSGFVASSTSIHVATVTFRAKSSGATQLVYSSQSQVGQLAGKNVKNSLDATSGSVITITTPPSSTQPPTETAPPPPVAPSADPTQPADPESASSQTNDRQDQETSASDSSSSNTAIDADEVDETSSLVANDVELIDVADRPAIATNRFMTPMNVLLAVAGIVTVAGGLFVYGYRYFGWFAPTQKPRHILSLGGTAMYAADYIAPERLNAPIGQQRLPAAAQQTSGLEDDSVTIEQPIEESVVTESEELESLPPTNQLTPYLKPRRLRIPRRRR